jgi:hypothetical protein
MKPTQIFVAVPVALLAFGSSVASAGKSVEIALTIACVTDKWDEKEPEKGHKLVDYAGRCVNIPDDPAAPKYTEDCVAKYEYMPDESWKGSGTCTWNFKGSNDKVFDTFEEGSHLKGEALYKITGGTGKYEGAEGGGPCKLDELTDTLQGGRCTGRMEQP